MRASIIPRATSNYKDILKFRLVDELTSLNKRNELVFFQIKSAVA